ncbi:MAG: GAF domain-containing sensor histidine kinase [Campylobacterales bacterium]|nr:GAF domain-containing sensor histidine kinase [Campylobacterales bacterium]
MDYKDKLELLLDLGKVISKEHDLDELLTVLSDITIKILTADRCSIFLLDKKKNELWSKVAQGVEKKIIVPLGKGIAGYTAESQEIQIVIDAYNDIRFYNEIDKITGYKTDNILTVPLINKNDETLGVFQVLNKTEGFFDNEDAEILILLAEYVSSILENAMLYDSLKGMNESLEKKVQEEVEKNREKDRQLIQQGKMIAVSDVIGNIAHQWRQPLNVVSLLVQNIEMTLENDGVVNKEIDKSLLSVNQILDELSITIDDFRTFFNPNRQKEEFLILDALNDALSMVKGSIDENAVELYIVGNKKLKHYGYKNELCQVFVNLFNNSIDAFIDNESYGEIEISIEEIDNHVVIIFKDNGGGIKEDIHDSIFEPYTTTKHKAQGTGIGLYMVKSVIEIHMDGTITSKNTMLNNQEGASFKIKLKCP